jgi:hypothetical protein
MDISNLHCISLSSEICRKIFHISESLQKIYTNILGTILWFQKVPVFNLSRFLNSHIYVVTYRTHLFAVSLRKHAKPAYSLSPRPQCFCMEEIGLDSKPYVWQKILYFSRGYLSEKNVFSGVFKLVTSTII